MNKPTRYGLSVILDKYLSIKEPDYVKFMEERLWDNFKDLIIKELKENSSIVVEKAFDMQEDLSVTGQLKFRQDISITKLIHCHDCGKYEEAKNGCNGFCKEWNTPTYSWDWCSRRAEKDGEENE